MNKILAIAIGVVTVCTVHAQDIERSVIGSLGISYSGGSVKNDCTVGETVIFTGQSANVDLTQGFHQPIWMTGTCPGDFDLNGVINVNDLLMFAGFFGCASSCTVGDMDGNGAVNVNDLLLLAAVFGTSCP